MTHIAYYEACIGKSFEISVNKFAVPKVAENLKKKSNFHNLFFYFVRADFTHLNLSYIEKT